MALPRTLENKILLKAIGLLALLGLVVWAVLRVPLGEVWGVLTRLSASQLVVLALLNGLIFCLFTLRWWLIMRGLGAPIPFLALIRYRLAAFSLNYFTPGPQFGGEPLQVYLLQRRHEVSMESAISGVTLDKLIEMLANFVFLAAGLQVVLQAGLLPALSGARVLPVVLGVILLAVGYLGALRAGYSPLGKVMTRLVAQPARGDRKLTPGQVLASAARTAEREASTVMRTRPLVLLWALAISLTTWGVMIYEYGLMLRFLGVAFGLPETIAALTAARLAFLSPLPGGVGILEASQVLALTGLGAGLIQGVSLSLLIRARDILLGLAGLWAGGLVPNTMAIRATTRRALSGLFRLEEPRSHAEKGVEL